MSFLNFILVVPVENGGSHEHIAEKVPHIAESVGKILPDQVPGRFLVSAIGNLFLIQVIAAASGIAKQLVVFIFLKSA